MRRADNSTAVAAGGVVHVRVAHRPHRHLLGQQRLRTDRRAERAIHRHRRRWCSLLRAAHRRHRHLLGPKRLRPRRRAERTIHHDRCRPVALLRAAHRRHDHLLGLEPFRANRRAGAGQFTAIAAGRGHSCALRSDGTATCWGRFLTVNPARRRPLPTLLTRLTRPSSRRTHR